MKTVDINLGARSYAIRIGRGLLSAAAEIRPWLRGGQVCIVSDEAVAPLYLQTLRDALGDERQVLTKIMPCGEEVKSLDGAASIFDALLESRFARDATVIALGGGVVGDLAGFAAACYLRGVDFIQIPTTLLAQVDSAVGGKTGVNHPLGKNMIGAFYQPRRVIADTATLDSLPRRQFAAGLAEVIKYGVIGDPGDPGGDEFFVWLEANIDAVLAREADALAHVIARCCEMKAAIVAADEREAGARALLNLGHTFGHAIEAGAGYGNWLHGEAVATGMVMAAEMAVKMGMMTVADAGRVTALLQTAGLPVAAFDGLSAEKMLALMRGDKKVRGGVLRLILPRGIGRAEVVGEYPREVLTATVERFAKG